jgi:nicotinamide phosphoribosyltransferase
MAKMNPILNTDSYKLSHFQQYPPGTARIASYIETRGTSELAEGITETVHLGAEQFVRDTLEVPFYKEDIEEAEDIARAHMVPFHREGFDDILNRHGGYWPIEVLSAPEGTLLPIGTPSVFAVNVDKKHPWVTSFLETDLLRSVWYPTTVATLSRAAKQIMKKYLLATGSSLDGLQWMLNDFGSRGVSSLESCRIGGYGHLTQFRGTDNLAAISYIKQHHGDPCAGESVIASEHSTQTSWGRSHEVDAYRALLATAAPGQIVSAVSDSYNIWDAVRTIWGGILKDEVVAFGAKGCRLVVRPDSGDPKEVPIRCVEILMEQFAEHVTKTSTGHRLLPPFLRVIQGDGINMRTIEEILTAAAARGLAAENFVFGMGGGLLQQLNRDTFKFAMKACARQDSSGAWHDVYKDPVHGGKMSKRGLMYVRPRDRKVFTTSSLDEVFSSKNLLERLSKVGSHMDVIRDRSAI